MNQQPLFRDALAWSGESAEVPVVRVSDGLVALCVTLGILAVAFVASFLAALVTVVPFEAGFVLVLGVIAAVVAGAIWVGTL